MSTFESKPILTLSIAAEILGVHPRTLMIYEKKGLVTPARTRTNRRRFSHKDIKELQFIRFLTQSQNLNLAGVVAVLKLIEKASNNGLDLKSEVFPNFSEPVDF